MRSFRSMRHLFTAMCTVSYPLPTRCTSTILIVLAFIFSSPKNAEPVHFYQRFRPLVYPHTLERLLSMVGIFTEAGVAVWKVIVVSRRSPI